MGPDPAVAACRVAVRRALPVTSADDGGFGRPQVRGQGCVLVACSGGADSLALLAAAIFEAHKASMRVIGAVVDHGLQEGSAAHTGRVVEQMARLGADETASIRVAVDPGPSGIEAGARAARYAAFGRLAVHFDADVVLLGHTLDDQAETVLLGLTHGSGPRSLQGMRDLFDQDGVAFVRPFLQISRRQTEQACRAQGVSWWEDPHNSDPRFVRSRIRHTVMPMLERELGPGIAETLARTAGLIRADVQALDSMAEASLGAAQDGAGGLDTSVLETYQDAIRTRVIRLAAIRAGAIAGELTREHIYAVADIARRAQDHRRIQLPGHLTAYRVGTSLRFGPTGVES